MGLAGGAAALAVASVPDSNGVIHACYPITVNGQNQTVPVTGTPTPYLRVIDPGAGQTCNTVNAGGTPPEATLSWNQAGPRGAPGATGPRGAQGRSVTLPTGNVITIAGVPITVGSSHGVTVETPPPTGRSVATLTLGKGGSALTFDVYSFSFGVQQAGAGGGGGAGKSSVHEIVITKRHDKSSNKLAQYCADGRHLTGATLTVRKAGKGQTAFLTYTFTTVFVSSYQLRSSGDEPSESLSLNFTKIKINYVHK